MNNIIKKTLFNKSLTQSTIRAFSSTPAFQKIKLYNTPDANERVLENFGLVEGYEWTLNPLTADYILCDNKRDACNRMIKKAEKMGANAILNVKYIAISHKKSLNEFLCYGTAVKLAEPTVINKKE